MPASCYNLLREARCKRSATFFAYLRSAVSLAAQTHACALESLEAGWLRARRLTWHMPWGTRGTGGTGTRKVPLERCHGSVSQSRIYLVVQLETLVGPSTLTSEGNQDKGSSHEELQCQEDGIESSQERVRHHAAQAVPSHRALTKRTVCQAGVARRHIRVVAEQEDPDYP